MSDSTDCMFDSRPTPYYHSKVSYIEVPPAMSSPDGKRSSCGATSKNTISERRRRRRLNERLYSLRAIVPVITKMDRASIIEDAINYIHQLQNQVKVAEEDIVRLQETLPYEKEIRRREQSDDDHKGKNIKELLEFDVSEVKENVYSIYLYCKCSPRAVLEVNRVIESMEMSVTYANFNSFDGYILTNIIAQKFYSVWQKEDGERLQVDAVKETISKIIME